MARTCFGPSSAAALMVLAALWAAAPVVAEPVVAEPVAPGSAPFPPTAPTDRRVGMESVVGANADTGHASATAERIQVIYDAATGEVQRRLVRIIDPHPQEKLDFTWDPTPALTLNGAEAADDQTSLTPEPAGSVAGIGPVPPSTLGLDEDGFASGQGTLTWRIPGTPAYDPRAFHSRYIGRLDRGAPQGEGVMLYRDGSWLAGTWHRGQLFGNGRWQQADGSLYTGPFEASLPQGIGLLRSAEGWSYTGSFEHGLPHGLGSRTDPGKAARAVQMVQGKETAASRRAEVVQAQASGDAARVEVSVVTNGRVSLLQDYAYLHHNDGERLHLLPQPMPLGDEGELAKLWEGGGPQHPASFFDYFSPSVARDMRAFLDVSVRTTDGSRVRLDGLDLVIDVSAPHLRPMLGARQPTGCTGFRPWLDLLNFGWGPVETPRLRVVFGTLDYEADDAAFHPETEWIDLPIDGFDRGATVDFAHALQQLGVDTGTLAGNRFTCPSYDMLETCAQNITASVPLGGIAQLTQLHDRTLRVPAQVELTYTWTDAWGQPTELVETFVTRLALAHLELPLLEAEMGDGGAFATPAPEYLEITLPTSGSDLFLPIPLRGNPNIVSTTANVQLGAEQSSFHALRFEARLGDGSVQSSMPIWFYALIPRLPDYTTTARPGACYLASDF